MNFCTPENFYYSGYSLAISVTDDVSTLRCDDAKAFYKIIYIESGFLRIRLGGKELILTGANALCMNEKDEIFLCGPHEHLVTIVYFKPSVINNKFDLDTLNYASALSTSENQDLFYLSKFGKDAGLPSKIIGLKAMESSVLKQKISLLASQLSLQDNNNWPCRSRSYLFEILFMLSRSDEATDSFLPSPIDSRFSKLSIDVIHYLQTSYEKKVTIDNLALMHHTNRTTLLADFKKSTGQSINRYVTEIRMTMAAALLRDTGLSINEICERTGFTDISYFSKSFKKEIKYTPSQYRRIHSSD